MFLWKKLFSEKLLKYGKANSNNVNKVKCLNNNIIANVKGKNNYFVKITLNNQEIKELSCNCNDNANCKHEAALLFYLDDTEWKIENEEKNLLKLIQNTNESDLKSLLIELAEDEKIKDIIIKKLYSKQKIDKKEIENYLNELIYNNLKNEDKIISEILFFLEYDIYNLIELGEYDFACALLNYIVNVYLINNEIINYNNESILITQYLNYSKILLNKSEVSEENKNIMREFVQELCACW